jgi:hypothetical protein
VNVVVAAVVTVVLLVAVGWALSRVMNFGVKQLGQMRGFSRFTYYEDADHPRGEEEAGDAPDRTRTS